MAIFTETAGEIGALLRTVFGLSRPSRIRDQIRDSTQLYAMTVEHEGLSAASENLAKVVVARTQHLVELTSNADRRDWNWPAAIVSWFVAAGCGVGICYLAPRWGTWWATLVIVVLGCIGSLLFIAGFGVLLQRTADEA